MNNTTKQKKSAEPYQPPGFILTSVANYAKEIEKTPARVYQLFQEGKIELVSIDGVQFVKTDTSLIS